MLTTTILFTLLLHNQFTDFNVYLEKFTIFLVKEKLPEMFMKSSDLKKIKSKQKKFMETLSI